MQALVLTAAGLELQTERPVRAPRDGEALIAVHLAGVCATDIELTRGYKGGFRGILGHEFVGTVIAAPHADEWVGRRVVGEINVDPLPVPYLHVRDSRLALAKMSAATSQRRANNRGALRRLAQRHVSAYQTREIGHPFRDERAIFWQI